VECDRYREALSARTDGEDLQMAEVALDRHLTSCAGCREWVAVIAGPNRALRLHPADHVPDLTLAILAAIGAERRRAVAHGRRSPASPGGAVPAGVLRLSLALVAASHALVALPSLFGNDLGAPVHVAHEQGAWALALAVGLAVGAWRPDRAAALVPPVGAFVGVMAVLGSIDVLDGRVMPNAELPHVMSALGLLLLWVIAHPPCTRRSHGERTGYRAAV